MHLSQCQEFASSLGFARCTPGAAEVMALVGTQQCYSSRVSRARPQHTSVAFCGLQQKRGRCISRCFMVFGSIYHRAHSSRCTPESYITSCIHAPHLPSALRTDMMASISSMKMTEGCMWVATSKSALTSFSPSPSHLLIRSAELMLKKVAFTWLAMHLPIRVLPVPGGPNSSSPLAGLLLPCMPTTADSLPHTM